MTILLGLTAPAWAQDLRPVELRKLEVEKQVREEKKREAKPTAPVGPARAGMTVEERQVRIAENERAMSDKRKEMIRLIDEMLSSNPRYSARYERLVQRAELEWDEAQYQYFVTRRSYEAALDRGEKPKEPNPDYAVSIATYQQIQSENPQFERIDEVRFHLGFALEAAGRHLDALESFAELVRKNAASRFAPDAYLAMGEIWFELVKLGPARDNYASVVSQFGKSKLAGYARYKLGWTYVNEKKYAEAATVLQEVVNAGGAYGRIDLRDQALADLLVVFAEMPDGVSRARTYYNKVLKKGEARKFLLLMARHYDSQDKLEPALELIALLQQDAPTLPDLPDVHAFRVEMLKRGGDLKRLDVELAQLAAFYEIGSVWDRANQGNTAARTAALALLEESHEYLAIREHEEAQRSHDEARYRRAAEAYAQFLKRFPASPRCQKVRFYYAETLLKAGAFAEAAAQYRQVVAQGASDFYEEAAYKTLFCFAEAMRRQGLDPEAVLVSEREDIPKTALSPLEVDFVAASDEFVKNVPTSPDAPAVLFKAAKTYYLHGELELAAARFIKIIELAPKHRYAAFAGTLALDCYNRLRDWPGMVKWARYLLVHKNFEHKSPKDLRDVIARASANAVEILEKRGQYAEAAEAMIAVVEEYPKSESADRNLYNAAALYERAGQRDQAEVLYTRVRRDYPGAEYAARAAFILGAMAEARGDFGKAAKEYESLAGLPKVEQSADAVYNAGLLREALGDFEAALAARRRYVETFPEAPDVHEVFFAIGPLLERLGRNREARSHYQEYLKRYAGKSLLRAMDAYLRTDHFERVVEIYKESKEPAGSPTAGRAAEARFRQAEILFREFDEVSLKVSEAKMEARVTRKNNKMDRTIRAYIDVAEFRDPEWSAAAAYKIGLCYQRFSEALLSAPIPRGLKVEEKEVYRAQLQEMALPFEEKAISNFERAVRLAHEGRIYNQWTALSAQHLAKYRPSSFPLIERPAVQPVYVAE